jgi:hypothetical protein
MSKRGGRRRRVYSKQTQGTRCTLSVRRRKRERSGSRTRRRNGKRVDQDGGGGTGKSSERVDGQRDFPRKGSPHRRCINCMWMS